MRCEKFTLNVQAGNFALTVGDPGQSYDPGPSSSGESPISIERLLYYWFVEMQDAEYDEQINEVVVF